MNLMFVMNSILLGAALAMDAFSVSLANGFAEPDMKKDRYCLIAGTYAFFQFIMPVAGWACIHLAIDLFSVLERFVPYVALILLCIIGGKMVHEGIRGNADERGSDYKLGFGTLLLQGIATSIDALSVGLTLASYNLYSALTAAAIIAVVTFIICLSGLFLGRKAGTYLSDKAVIAGGILLILIGIEIFIRGKL